ncbi:hypothetical protein ACQ4PT_009809 [Festuca glaucescens]
MHWRRCPAGLVADHSALGGGSPGHRERLWRASSTLGLQPWRAPRLDIAIVTQSAEEPADDTCSTWKLRCIRSWGLERHGSTVFPVSTLSYPLPCRGVAMVSASGQSAAAKPQSLSPSPPMARSDAVQSPKAMTTAEVAAAIAALPAKKDALREAFDRLAACSPFPLPFAWVDLDAHISSIQSSISLRYRQLQVLESARPAPVLAPVPTGDEETSEEEEQEEEEEEVEEEEEEDEEEEEAEEEEEDEEVVEEVVVEEEEEEVEMEEEGEEVEEVEEEVEVEEDVDANNVVNKEQKADEEMLEAQEEEVKEHKKLVANDKEHKVHKVDEGEEEQEESDGEMEEETGEAKKGLLKGAYPALQGVAKHLVKACATMNTASLVNIVFKNNIPQHEHLVAIRHAKDAAALILDVVRLFLPNKNTKTNKVWENCVMLIRCVPLVEPKLSVHTTEQAKQLAKNWKKMIDKEGGCGDLGYMASWAFLYFLISYNIVSEFDVREIIRLFGTVPRKYQRKDCIDLCNGLGLVSRISDLIDYLVGNGQELSAIRITQVLKLLDKYPPLSLLEGYVEKAKRTALELFSKNVSDKSLNPARTREMENLWFARTIVKQQEAESSKSIAILEEINNLLAEYAKSRNLINGSAALKLNSCQQQKNQLQKEEQKYKKRKKEQQQHEGRDRQVQGKQRKLEGNQEQPQEKRQQLPQHKPQESKDQQRHENKGQKHHNAQAKKQKQQQQQIEPLQRPQQQLNQPRPCVTKQSKLATPVGPSSTFVPAAVPSVAQISPTGHQPFAVIPGASQPHFPGIQARPFAANGVPPQYNSFQQNPLYSHPSFYPR